MAIIIPSKSIYDKDNPKIRDNNIKKIEVEAKSTSLNKEFDTQVYNINGVQNVGTITNTATGYSEKGYSQSTFAKGTVRAYLYSKIDVTTLNLTTTTIPSKIKNGYIKEVYFGLKETGENVYEANIKKNVVYEKTVENIELTFYPKEGEFIVTKDWLERATMGEIVEKGVVSKTNVSGSLVDLEEKIGVLLPVNFTRLRVLDSHTFTYKSVFMVSPVSTTATIDEHYFYNEHRLNTNIILENDIYKVEQNDITPFSLGSVSVIMLKCGADDITALKELTFEGTRTTYTPVQIDFDFYGDTITLELTDEVKVLGDTTSKEVTSFDGNELMQVREPFYAKKCYVYNTGELVGANAFHCTKDLVKIENNKNYKVNIYNFDEGTTVHGVAVFNLNKEFITYINCTNNEFEINFEINNESDYYVGINFYKEGGISALNGTEYYELNGKCYSIVRNYNKVINEYKNGKETATILCSINNYYDENGEKVVDMSGKNKKMLFDLYDEVIPMVLNANGQDVPMSLHKNGSPKVFKVLGNTPYFDGAVWQELTLQEV